MNIRNLFTFTALIALFTIIPVTASAETVVRTGESVSVEKDQSIDGDFYTAASILNISGEVNGDLLALGGKTTLNGKVASDTLMIGGNVDVHGAVGDDLRIVAGEAIIAEPVTGDVFVIGGNVKVLSTASIGGDLLVYGGTAEVSGPVGGNVHGNVGTLRIDAPVAGSVDVTTDSLTLGDRADIAGSVRYVSATELTRSQNARVGGEITRSDETVESSTVPLQSILLPILMVLFSILVWYLIARRLLERIVARALTRSVRPVINGFFTLFGAPVVAGILIVTVLGSFVGVTMFVAYLLALLLAMVSGVAVFGQLVMMHIPKQQSATLTPLTLGVGVVATGLCLFIPLIGPVLLLTVFMITLGAIVDLLLHPHTS